MGPTRWMAPAFKVTALTIEMEVQITENPASELLVEQTDLMNEAAQLMDSVLSNLYEFFQELTASSSIQDPDAFKVIEETEEQAKKLTSYIDLVHEEIDALTGAIDESDCILNDLRSRNDSLQSALSDKDMLLKELGEKQETLKKKAIEQANYTAAMGSIMGSMLWKTSKTEMAINTYISESMIHDFISVANVTLNSFVQQYVTTELPLVESNEFKMMISTLGVCVNISAQMKGREFVVNEGIGIIFIENVLKYLGDFPMPAGHLLKRMSLMFLFNVIILRRGARIVRSSSEGIANILSCLSPDHSDEIHKLVLELLIFLMEQVQTEELDQQILSLISKENMELLMNGDENMRNLCLKFHKMFTDFPMRSV